MPESSWPSADGGSVTEAKYEYLMGALTPDGLIGDPTLSATVFADSSGRQVKVRGYRYAVVRGFMWHSGDGLTLSIKANTTKNTRIDKVVLRLDRKTWKVSAVVLQGTAASAPVAPAHETALPPNQFFDLPLATVRVPAGSAGVAAGDVTHIGWYLPDPPTAGVSAARPPHQIGRIFRDVTHKRLWVGVESSKWKSVQYDTGWVVLDRPGTWGGDMRVRHKNGWVTFQARLKRTGGEVPKKTNNTLFTLSAGYRPTTETVTAAVVSDPDHTTYLVIDTAGKVSLRADDTHVIKKDSWVYANVTYPIDD